MRAATSVQDVLADPIGAYFAGRSFVVWFQPQLAGAFVFRSLDRADDNALAELLVSPVLAPGYDLMCDCGAVELFDDRGFKLLSTVLDQHAHLLARVRRLAIVRPGGLAGAGLAGLFYDRVDPFLDAGLFSDRSEALAWLGYSASSSTCHEIDQLIATVHAVPVMLRRLRELLVRDVAGATLSRAAKELGTSQRSLQRELACATTTFRSELTHARVRVAESLLADTDDKIEAIARQLGFASVPAFTALFGRVVGESPQEFRRRRSRRTTDGAKS